MELCYQTVSFLVLQLIREEMSSSQKLDSLIKMKKDKSSTSLIKTAWVVDKVMGDPSLLYLNRIRQTMIAQII
jgi:hypothetical protein